MVPLWDLLHSADPYAKTIEYAVIFVTLIVAIYASRKIRSGAKEIQHLEARLARFGVENATSRDGVGGGARRLDEEVRGTEWVRCFRTCRGSLPILLKEGVCGPRRSRTRIG